MSFLQMQNPYDSLKIIQKDIYKTLPKINLLLTVYSTPHPSLHPKKGWGATPSLLGTPHHSCTSPVLRDETQRIFKDQ